MLNGWADSNKADASAPINKRLIDDNGTFRPETILDRQKRFVTTQFDKPDHSITFSDSINDKRVQLLDRAMAFLSKAPPSEVGSLADGLMSAVPSEKLAQLEDTNTTSRKFGPRERF